MAAFLALNLVLQSIAPYAALALTSGPSQPEIQSFEPAGTTQMVDPFSGDFTYNIPLFELPGPNGGYPFNLAYHSGVNMDQEASWVGLGWNLNVGAVNRQMRGLPDDFSGGKDEITKKTHLRPNRTFGIAGGGNTEAFGKSGFLSLGVELQAFYNNYKGVGLNLEPSLNFIKSLSGSGQARLGLNFSLNTQEGAGLSPSLSLSSNIKGKGFDFNVAGNLSSRRGLSDISLSSAYRIPKMNPEKGVAVHTVASANLSLAESGYTPQVSLPYRATQASFLFRGGASFFTIFGNGFLRGFYNEQKIKDNGKTVAFPAYGYLHLQEDIPMNGIMDFNREKDGSLFNNTPNLPIPNLTYDIYSVNAQGMSGMFRPCRSDIGILRDNMGESSTFSASLGIDAPVFKAGVNGSVSLGSTVSGGQWKKGKGPYGQTVDFKRESSGDIGYEPYYFQSHGEMTPESIEEIDRIYDDKIVSAQLTGGRKNPYINALKVDSETQWLDEGRAQRQHRKVRSATTQALTNAELAGSTVPGEFRPTPSVARNDADRSKHVGAFVSTNAGGTRYVYALPAYNHKQVECQFSTPHPRDPATTKVEALTEEQVKNLKDGDRYYQRTEISAYPYAHLLTAVLGPDYVDVDGNGPSAKDLGYWVRFNYERKEANYKWRAPYHGANYSEGQESRGTDDKGSYLYGEKEVYYLKSAETKSHIALFSLSGREDGRGAFKEVQNAPPYGARSHRLDKISLYSKGLDNARSENPIKSVHFDYSYDLCRGVPNNALANGGKLTLKGLHFTYEKNQRGGLNPYRFDYYAEAAADGATYDTRNYDRWGNRNTFDSADPDKRNFPYVYQGKEYSAAQRRDDLTAWNLKRIQMPSGGSITIDYEPDDYAYVQHKEAMQMMPIVSVAPNLDDIHGNQLYTAGSSGRSSILFPLETPIAAELSPDERYEKLSRYLDDTGQLYFRARVRLKGTVYEKISGYADIRKQPNGRWAIFPERKSDSGDFTHARIELMRVENEHPIAVAAWQHIRLLSPDLIYNRNFDNNDLDLQAAWNAVRSLVSLIPEVKSIFQNFHRYAKEKRMARFIDTDYAYVRLNTPDGIKYGGGLRVRQVSMDDNWSDGYAGTYGQYYEYTKEAPGYDAPISSGVAAYEPLIGGDAIALRKARTFQKKVLLKSNERHFVEYPMNESHYPGPQVGYSKVSVYSLVAAKLAGKPVDYELAEGEHPSTTGKMVHEFHTAREYPVFSTFSDIDARPFKRVVPAPFATLTETNFTASQGYVVELNNMHGKPKKMSYFAQASDGSFPDSPLSYVSYSYRQTRRELEGRETFVLNNKVNTLREDHDDGQLLTGEAYLGRSQEMYSDMRRSEEAFFQGGLEFNLDIVLIPILFPFLLPMPSIWPSGGVSTSSTRTVVMNKVIHRSGILEKVTAHDRGSTIVTENLLWDHATGEVVLTKVNNNFEEPIYSYNLPAHLKYPAMGPAYRNQGLRFTTTFATVPKGSGTVPDLYRAVDSGQEWQNLLHPGDAFIIGNGEAMARYSGEENGAAIFHSQEDLSSLGESSALLYRSGRRNLLSTTTATLSSKKNPLEKKNRGLLEYTKEVPDPNY